jgi:hypothetical protein
MFEVVNFHSTVISFLNNLSMHVKAKFDINTDGDLVQKACLGMMKSVFHQQRYTLKKNILILFHCTCSAKCLLWNLSDEQWNQLVEVWKNPIKIVCCLYIPKFFSLYMVIWSALYFVFMQATCEKNKANQAKVRFHQTTDLHSYMVHCENLISHLCLLYTAVII